MSNPFKYRPHVHGENVEVEEWENNWLSNSMAWASDTFVPNACEDPEGWAVWWTNFIWADCACCMAMRNLTVGAAIATPIAFAVGLLF